MSFIRVGNHLINRDAIVWAEVRSPRRGKPDGFEFCLTNFGTLRVGPLAADECARIIAELEEVEEE